jgi:hypothetical protein
MKTCAQCGSTAADSALKCPNCKALLVAGPGGATPSPQTAAPVAVGSAVPTASSYSPASAYPPASGYPQNAPAAPTAASGTGGDLLPRGGAVASAPANWGASSGAGFGVPPTKGRLAQVADSVRISDRRSPALYASIGCAVVIVALGAWFVIGRSHHSTSAGSTAPAPRTTAPRARLTHGPTAVQRAQANRDVQDDLHNALTAEKVAYTDQQAYVASPSALRAIEPSIAWGTRMHVTVADAASPGDHGIVCLSEKTVYGNTYSIADVEAGPTRGIYLGPRPCPAAVNARTVTAIGPKVGP